MIKNFIIILQTLIIIFLTWKVIFTSNSEKHTVVNLDKQIVEKSANSENVIDDLILNIELIESEGNTWGYKILMHGSPFIVQPNIPGLPGNKGFKTKEMALKAGERVLEKIKNGQMPPTLTYEELKDLGVLDL